MRYTAKGIMLVLLLPLLSGCILWDEEGTAVPLPDDRPDLEAYTVVAPIDTGINVYHNHFIMNESFPSSLLEGLNVTMICDISTEGTWQERYDADKEDCWDQITTSDIVWFRGTRIIGTSPDDGTDIPLSLIHI